jgi:dephospho-CoA kinase
MIHVITGPPCGGKSTHIKTHAQPGDIIIDMDRLALALTIDGTGSHEYSAEVRRVARSARKGAVTEAMKIAHLMRNNVWIIHTDPPADDLREYRAHSARITLIDPGRAVCLERAQQRPIQNQRLVKEVLEKYYNKLDRANF